MSRVDEDELKKHLKGTKFESVLERLAKRAENGDARMRHGLAKADKLRMLEKLHHLKEELESLKHKPRQATTPPSGPAKAAARNKG